MVLSCSLLAVQTGTTLHICQQGVLQRRACATLVAAQLSSHIVAVESISGTTTIRLNANLQIRGLLLLAPPVGAQSYRGTNHGLLYVPDQTNTVMMRALHGVEP